MEGLKKLRFINLLLSLVVLMAFTVPAEVFAITNSEEWGLADFNFTPPGARASGMGGAFVALADDATCALSNPAGLAQLPRTQIAAEATYRHYDDKYDTKNWPEFDNLTTYTDTKIKNNTRLSFASFSTPLFDNFINVSLFYNKLVYSNSEFVYGSNTPDREFKQPGYNKVAVDEYGLSLAKAFFGEKLFVGAGFSEANLDLKSNFVFRQYKTTSSGTYNSAAESTGSSTKMAYRAGVLFVPWDFLRFGANYSRMPAFNYQYVSNAVVSNNSVIFKSVMEYKIPDTFSVGAAVKPLKNWTIITEGKYVKYSDLMDGFVPTKCIQSSKGGCANPGDLKAENYDIPDIWEFHLGTEYILYVKETPIAIRTGTYYEPKHSLYANENTSYNDLYKGGRDAWHWTGGIGTVLFKHWQIDGAVDLAKDRDKLTISMVYQF
ncbi:MAG: outer membrane protein transport protein [Nitrospirae bacterium]|uniref:OmpP1/FadL family transporter n=1 Tax=Candidatus Magnetobacterium casense TaxID=1455061 RepID=UPI00058FE943|nr:outer membrane protein transport protein [Candidatus Magnetobacterium casensis]MBF0339207.1 outer membrane protein transport protein [Nitrospirota bacterium]